MRKSILTIAGMLLLCPIALSAQEKPYKAYMVSNAHFDTQWDWDIQTSINEYLANTLQQNFYLLERYPDYVFNFEGAVKYHWMREYYPEGFEKVRDYIREGRWRVTGSAWDANDPNLPSSESFLRNVMLGQHFYIENFGTRGNDIFLPDCFGFGMQLPTLAAHAGLKGFSTQKLQWRARNFRYNGRESKIPFRIGLWHGLDGGTLLGVLDAGNYNFQYKDEDLSKNPEINAWAKECNGTAYRYYGTGDFGGSPDIPSVNSVMMGMKGDGPVQILSAGAGDIYEDFFPYENHPELPEYSGELLMDIHATGCYSSQSMMKRMNRRNEQLADAAERAGVMADWLGAMPYAAGEIRSEWKRFLWHQFHDDLTGTSIPKAYTYSWNDEIITQTRFADLLRSESAAIAGMMDTNVEGTPVVVYNQTAHDRRDLVQISAKCLSEGKSYIAVAPDGRKSPVQICGDKAIFAANVKASSYSVYSIQEGAAKAAKSMKVSGNSLENSIYKVSLNANGDIVSMIDKRSAKQLVGKGGAFRLAFFEKNPSNLWPAWEIMPETLMERAADVDENVKISVVENGPVRVSVKVERSKNGSSFVQYLSLTEGAADDKLSVSLDFDWDTEDALLKAEFCTSVNSEEASYDIGVGNVRRGINTLTQYEVFAHQWADISAGSYGVSVMNDCKYGWDKPDAHTIRLTLLHSPSAERERSYQRTQDHGHHHVEYAIRGHKGAGVKESGINVAADCHNRPLIAMYSPKHGGSLGKEFAFVRSSTPQISVKALKQAENGEGYIVRINEIWGEPAKNARIIFPCDVELAYRTNGIEERSGEVSVKGNAIEFSTTAFHPETFFIKLKGGRKATVSTGTPVDLPYNKFAFTSDAFQRQGHFDRESNSYSLDLIPSVISDRGVNFRMQTEEGREHCVRCDGQTIKLPASEGMLHLLVASDNIDRAAEFEIGGQKYSFNVPYYSGFYGQWGRKGFSEGYVKDGHIAHVGTHRHNKHCGNEAYILTYMFRISIPLSGSDSITLPKSGHINVFAATVSDGSLDGLCYAEDPRALPLCTKEVAYEK